MLSDTGALPVTVGLANLSTPKGDLHEGPPCPRPVGSRIRGPGHLLWLLPPLSFVVIHPIM